MANNANFNSIKVQLKLSGNINAYTDATQFQFHKGTIKTQNPRYRKPVIYVFQFHKGTIKTQ